jgi:hypothetical protein
METFVKCLVEPNGQDCFIPTVQAITLQTATRGLMELFKSMTVSNFASLGAISRAFQYVSVVSASYKAVGQVGDGESAHNAAGSIKTPHTQQKVRVKLSEGGSDYSYIWMTSRQQKAAAATTNVRSLWDNTYLIEIVPTSAPNEQQPPSAQIPEIVEIDGKKYERKSTVDEHFMFNPKENFRYFLNGIGDRIRYFRNLGRLGLLETSKLIDTDIQFEARRLRGMDVKGIKYQKKDGKIQQESASVNGKDDQKAEKIEGWFDFTNFKNNYQSSKIYTYVHKPLQSTYQGMVDLKNWRPISVRDFLTNWRSIPMVPLAILGQIYKGMTWLNAKFTKFANALGDLTTQFVKSMARWVEDSARLLISQFPSEQQVIFGFGKILEGANKIVNKIAENVNNKVDIVAKHVGDYVKQKTRNFVFDIAEDKILGNEKSGWLRWTFDKVKTCVLQIVGGVNVISDKLDEIQNALANKSASMWNEFVGINLVKSFGKMIADVMGNIPEKMNENQPPTDDQKEQLGQAFKKAGKIITPFVDAIQGILKPGGISRFVYIMLQNKETYDQYIVIGRQDSSETVKWIRHGILHLMKSSLMHLAIVSDLAVSIVMNIGSIMKSLVSNGIDVIKGFIEQIMNVGSFLTSGVMSGAPDGSQQPSGQVKFSMSGFKGMWSAISNLSSDFLNAFSEIFQVFKLGILRWVDTEISDGFWGLGWVKNKGINLVIPQNFYNSAQNKDYFMAAGSYRKTIVHLQ